MPWRFNGEKVDELAAHPPGPTASHADDRSLRQNGTGGRPTPASHDANAIGNTLPSQPIVPKARRVDGSSARSNRLKQGAKPISEHDKGDKLALGIPCFGAVRAILSADGEERPSRKWGRFSELEHE